MYGGGITTNNDWCSVFGLLVSGQTYDSNRQQQMQLEPFHCQHGVCEHAVNELHFIPIEDDAFVS